MLIQIDDSELGFDTKDRKERNYETSNRFPYPVLRSSFSSLFYFHLTFFFLILFSCNTHDGSLRIGLGAYLFNKYNFLHRLINGSPGIVMSNMLRVAVQHCKRHSRKKRTTKIKHTHGMTGRWRTSARAQVGADFDSISSYVGHGNFLATFNPLDCCLEPECLFVKSDNFVWSYF